MMHSLGRWKIRHGAVAAAGALALSVAGYAAPAGAAPAMPAAALPGSVSPRPAAGTPELVPAPKNGKDQIRQMVQCGDTMYAVGSFSSVVQGGSTIPRTNVFSFSATAPYTITSWAPAVNGIVNSIAFNGTNCADAYIGGDFSSINGTAVTDIAEIDTTAGDVVPGFGTSTAGGQVETLLAVDNHLLVGGHFTWINGSHADPYFASVSPLTGKDDGFVHLQISGYYNYCGNGSCTSGKSSSVYNQQLSHGGTLDLVEGDFTSVGGLARQQIFMLNLATSPATVTGWTSPEWDGSDGNLPDGYPYQCAPIEAFYIRSAAWSPDDQTVYIATNGYHPWNLPTGSYPRSGLCDAAAAFPATQTSVTHLWVNYTGCDSYYSVAADDSAVYVAGHQRWSENPKGCNHAGPGAIPDPGLQGLDPATGALELRPDNSPVYSMSRANADNMLITGAGLWISSSNRYGSQYCGKVADHSGICLLPYPNS
jgi:hypothetical protein